MGGRIGNMIGLVRGEEILSVALISMFIYVGCVVVQTTNLTAWFELKVWRIGIVG